MNRHLTTTAVSAIAAVAVAVSPVVVAPAHATYPNDNGLLAFSAATDAGLQIFTVRPDGRGLRQVTHDPAGAGAPDFSPDGRWLAYGVEDCTIALIRVDGTHRRAVPSQSPDGCETGPRFTPDGEHLVFERWDPATEDNAIWIMDLDGTDRRRIGTGPGGAATPEVSPDGRVVTFLSTVSEDRGALFAVRVRGGAVRQVTPTLYGITYKHDWAPDGSRLVMSDNSDDAGHPTNLVTIRPDGSGLRYLTHLKRPEQKALAGGYSPDGRWISYRIERGARSALMIRRVDGHGKRVVLPFSDLRPRFIDWGPAVD